MSAAINAFVEALDEFRETYNELLAVAEQYPPQKGEQAGACGWWSAKQVLAHLSGWIVRASERYTEIDAGDTRDVYYYDVIDEFNALSVNSRAHLGWRATITDLRDTVAQFSHQASQVPPDKQRNDKRYGEWLVNQTRDCRAHIQELRAFLNTADDADVTVTNRFPILEFDADPQAIIEPGRVIKPIDIAEHCVLCFFQDVITDVCGDGKARIVHHLGSELGQNPIYELVIDGQRLAVVHPGVGAPLAAGFLEELIALGCRTFIACGGAGVLNSAIAVGHVVIPTSAVRDEGTSYHYLPAGHESQPTSRAVKAIETVLEQHHAAYVTGKTWTTDGLYRETRAKMERRKAEGCITVEMEAAAFFAVAQFRGVTFGQLLYGGDDISGDQWDHRDWQRHSSREKLFWLAAEACLQL
jgi:uridine phosphorylase